MTATPDQDVLRRVQGQDWLAAQAALDAQGFTVLPGLVTPDECAELVALYARPNLFRARIEMARYRFGVGDYQYFGYPLPPLVQALRMALYPALAVAANRWAAQLGMEHRFPDDLDTFLTTCHAAGQARPTPLLLHYEAGGYNCLHQDVYGALGFPLQVVVGLSRPDTEYGGGAFLLVEQRPRAQSRGEAIVLEPGAGLVFTNRYRPVQGSRGYYRATVKHGVSTVHWGTRYTLGLIFHDAA